MMWLRWRDVQVPVAEVPEVATRYRVAEHATIGGATQQEITGTEARVLAARIILAGPWRDTIPDLDAALREPEGILEHPTEGRLRAILRSLVVIRHADGSADYRIEWGVVGEVEEPAEPTPPTTATLAETISAGAASAMARMRAMANPVQVLAGIETARSIVAAARQWAGIASPATYNVGAISEALRALDAEVSLGLSDPAATLAAWRDTLETLGGLLERAYWSIPLPPTPRTYSWAVWDALATTAALAYAAAAAAGSVAQDGAEQALTAAIARAEDPLIQEALSDYRSAWRAIMAQRAASAIRLEVGESVIEAAYRLGVGLDAVLAATVGLDPAWLEAADA